MFDFLKNKDNLSHAYIVRGDFGSLKEEFGKALKEIGTSISSPGHYIFDGGTFGVDNARELMSWYYSNRGNNDGEYTLVILAPSVFKKDAQQMLLKILEEARHPYMFFIIVPDGIEVIETIISRVQTIRSLKIPGANAEEFVNLAIGEKIKKIAGDTKGMESHEVRVYTENLVRGLIVYFHAKGTKENKDILESLTKAQNALVDSYTAPKFILDYLVTVI